MNLLNMLARLFQSEWLDNDKNNKKNEISDHRDNNEVADALLAPGFISQLNQYYPWIF